METNIRQQIRNFVVDTFLFGQGDKLRDDASFLGEGIIDSTGILELVTYLEETYGISVADDELVPENLDSIDNIALYVQRKLSGDTSVASGQVGAAANSI